MYIYIYISLSIYIYLFCYLYIFAYMRIHMHVLIHRYFIKCSSCLHVCTCTCVFCCRHIQVNDSNMFDKIYVCPHSHNCVYIYTEDLESAVDALKIQGADLCDLAIIDCIALMENHPNDAEVQSRGLAALFLLCIDSGMTYPELHARPLPLLTAELVDCKGMLSHAMDVHICISFFSNVSGKACRHFSHTLTHSYTYAHILTHTHAQICTGY